MQVGLDEHDVVAHRRHRRRQAARDGRLAVARHRARDEDRLQPAARRRSSAGSRAGSGTPRARSPPRPPGLLAADAAHLRHAGEDRAGGRRSRGPRPCAASGPGGRAGRRGRGRRSPPSRMPRIRLRLTFGEDGASGAASRAGRGRPCRSAATGRGAAGRGAPAGCSPCARRRARSGCSASSRCAREVDRVLELRLVGLAAERDVRRRRRRWRSRADASRVGRRRVDLHDVALGAGADADRVAHVGGGDAVAGDAAAARARRPSAAR